VRARNRERERERERESRREISSHASPFFSSFRHPRSSSFSPLLGLFARETPLARKHNKISVEKTAARRMPSGIFFSPRETRRPHYKIPSFSPPRYSRLEKSSVDLANSSRARRNFNKAAARLAMSAEISLRLIRCAASGIVVRLCLSCEVIIPQLSHFSESP